MSEEIQIKLVVRLSELTSEIMSLEAQLDRLKRERNAIAHANDALEEIYSGAEAKNVSSALTYKQKVLLDAVPANYADRLTPSEISRACPTLDPGYIRTTLRRMAETGDVKGKDGSYWKTGA